MVESFLNHTFDKGLGNRSIIASPDKKGMRDYINTSVKSREVGRPLGPSIIDIDVQKYFGKNEISKYMTFSQSVLQDDIKEAVNSYLSVMDAVSNSQKNKNVICILCFYNNRVIMEHKKIIRILLKQQMEQKKRMMKVHAFIVISL